MRNLVATIFVLVVTAVQGATTNQLGQFGIVFQFDDEVEYGTFVNSEYWVVAPVTITNMTPAWDGTNNGWEINPTHQATQGFWAGPAGTSFGYTESLRPALPFTLTTNCSLVKTIAGETGSHSEILTAVVLTVLTNIPPDNGAEMFRPPYAGTNKPYLFLSNLQTNLLPSLSSAAVSNQVTLASVVTEFSKCLRMDHHSSNSRQFRPSNALFDYQPENTAALNNAMLRLMLDDSWSDKLPALILYTQHALDRAYIVSLGYRESGTGHNPMHRTIAAWGAVMLNLTDIKTLLATATGFHEDTFLYNGIPGPLWGESNTELAYWNYIMGNGGSRSNKDPYGLIDGGNPGIAGGAEYQVITSQALKGSALVSLLLPEMQDCFASGRFETLNLYSRRWVTNGAWTLPDPAAPYDGTNANYGVTFGPDGLGSYIAGAGRYPDEHGENADGGQYKSTFVESMWNNFSGNPAPPEDPPAGSTIRANTVRADKAVVRPN